MDATTPVLPSIPVEDRELTHEEWWELFHRLRLSQQAAYAEVGGPVAFIRSERDAGSTEDPC